MNHFSLPYDCFRSIYTYLGTYLIQFIPTVYCSFAYFLITSFYIEFCWYSLALVSDFESTLRKLNSEIMTKLNKKLSVSEHSEIKEKFCDLVKFHSDSVQLSLSFSQRQFIPFDHILCLFQQICSQIFNCLQENNFHWFGINIGYNMRIVCTNGNGNNAAFSILVYFYEIFSSF